jgi:hypothetical protein
LAPPRQEPAKPLPFPPPIRGTVRHPPDRLRAFDLNGPPDLPQYRWRSFNQICHYPLQLFAALCADFKVLPRGVFQKSWISERGIEGRRSAANT